jgi:hypothetical protein
MVAVAEAVRGQTNIIQKAAAITENTVVTAETTAAIAVAAAAAMATVEMATAAMAMAARAAAMAAATRQPWQCREGS